MIRITLALVFLLSIPLIYAGEVFNKQIYSGDNFSFEGMNASIIYNEALNTSIIKIDGKNVIIHINDCEEQLLI